VHATDVLHGVYYLTSQPIPGLQQVNLEGDLFHKDCSDSGMAGQCGALRGMRIFSRRLDVFEGQ